MGVGRMLVVEDEVDSRDLIKMYLENHHFLVNLAGSGQEALEVLETEQVDMVVLDIELPDLNGMEVCQAIRQKSAVPIIFVICRREIEDIYAGLALGADDYVAKPFDPLELVAHIQGHLKKRKIFKYLDQSTCGRFY